MGFLDLFRTDEVSDTKVLVCSVDPRFEATVKSDGQVYKRTYNSITTSVCPSVSTLTEALAQQYDVVHLLCDVSADGAIADSSGGKLSGAQLIQKCCDANVKLLWIASDNKPEAYANLPARGQKINVAMTTKRLGPYFALFVGNLTARLAKGEALPKVWAELMKVDSVQPDPPEATLSAGRGAVRLLAKKLS